MSANARNFSTAQRFRGSVSHAALCAAILVSASGVWSAAAAQTAQGPQAPEHYTLDANNIDVVMGTFNFSVTDAAIGPEDGGLAYSRVTAGEVQRGNLDAVISVEASGEVSPGVLTWSYEVSIGAQSTAYQIHDLESPTKVMISRSADGSTLQYNGSNSYTHTASDGTVRVFSTALANPAPVSSWTPRAGVGGRITQMTKPNGERLDWHYRSETVGAGTVHRTQSVTNNRAYQIKFGYVFNGDPATQSELTNFGLLSSVTAINNAVDYCNPSADACSGLTQAWPSATYARTAVTGGQRLDVTNALSQTTGYIYTVSSGGSLLTEIDWAEAGRAPLTVSYDAQARVSSFSDGGAGWVYDFQPSGLHFQNLIVTDPNGNKTMYRSRLTTGPMSGPTTEFTTINRLNYIIDPLGARTDTEYDGNGRLTAVQMPEGDRLEYTYDTRGNITESRRKAKPDTTTIPDIVVGAAYPTTCDNIRTCNKPTSVTDARGATTTFAYSPDHGGLLTETSPAPVSGAAQPQTRHAYATRQAWAATSTPGAYVIQPAIYLPVQTSSCATASPTPGCNGTADEVETNTVYQAGSVSAGSNLLPLTVSAGAGDGSLTATTTTTWTNTGDVRTVNGPLAGANDTTWYAYDALRRQIGVVRPDPDGAGALGFPATKTVYNADGLATSVQQGTTTGQNDTAFAAFSQLSRVDTAYDAEGRKAKDVEVMGSGTVAVTQYAYDAGDRLTCTAQRMNPAIYGSLPWACTLGTAGADGPDRISHTTYDAANRAKVVTSAYGTALAQATQTQEHTRNGQVDWIEDANGNRSDYTYDRFDRLVQLNLPSTTSGAHAANPSDFEQYGYDENGNRTSLRLRDNQTLTFTYDALNRQTVKTTPGVTGAADDVFTRYDNLGRQLSARFTHPTTGSGVEWTWDALGRQLTETAYGRTLTSQYDLAGRRTRLYWPTVGGVSDYIESVWDQSDRLAQLRENGVYTKPHLLYASVYDDLGRLKHIGWGNDTSTNWTFQANSRDYTLAPNPIGTAGDVTFSLGFNPAAQVKSRGISNSLYLHAPTTANQAYAADGLNRYSTVAGTSQGYDARGNLTSDGARTFGYDVENRLTSVSGAASMTLAYDPLGRLRQTTGGSGTTQFLYDGDRLVAEYDGAGVVKARYVHAAGVDNPVIWYEGSTLTDRRWLQTDSQGSIIAATGADGLVQGTPYTYGPYGEPDAAHGYASGSRFRYTGQISLRDAPLWHYKARVYSPELGRFLQTDPVGYADQMNLYAYVGNDPMNRTDPTGEEIKVGSTVTERDDGTTLTVVTIDFTAALSRQAGARLMPGATESNLAAALETQIESDYSKTYTDSDGNTVEYRTSATIRTGTAQGSEHSIVIVSSLPDGALGAAPGFENGNTAYISSTVFTEGSFWRTGSHEFGHLAGLRHPNDTNNPLTIPKENLMSQTRYSSSQNITRRQLQSIFRNSAFR